MTSPCTLFTKESIKWFALIAGKDNEVFSAVPRLPPVTLEKTSLSLHNMAVVVLYNSASSGIFLPII